MTNSITAGTLLLIAAAVFGLPGCSDPAAPTVLTVAAIAASNNQTAVAGTALFQGLRVKVRSADGPESGVTVTWSVSAGNISPASSRTDAAGIAAATWVLGTVPGVMTAAATLTGAQGSPVTFTATALPPTTATADPATEGQTGVVGTALARRLRVMVQSDGAPKAGVRVTWDQAEGSLEPASSVTNAAGVAAAIWTLGTVAGEQAVYAKAAGTQAPVRFSATALPGPLSGIHKLDGDAQTTPANHGFIGLIVSVTDGYGNLLEGQAVTWAVESGPVAFVTIGGATDGLGRSTTVVTPTGTPGAAVVRAALPGGGGSVGFALTVGPPAPCAVTLNTNVGAFVSAQNGSSNPAVDTIPAGETMKWTLDPFDYDNHSVISVGTPSFLGGGDFPYANPSAVGVTFTTTGTYHYADSYHPLVTGIVVVQ